MRSSVSTLRILCSSLLSLLIYHIVYSSWCNKCGRRHLIILTFLFLFFGHTDWKRTSYGFEITTRTGVYKVKQKTKSDNKFSRFLNRIFKKKSKDVKSNPSHIYISRAPTGIYGYYESHSSQDVPHAYYIRPIPEGTDIDDETEGNDYTYESYDAPETSAEVNHDSVHAHSSDGNNEETYVSMHLLQHNSRTDSTRYDPVPSERSDSESLVLQQSESNSSCSHLPPPPPPPRRQTNHPFPSHRHKEQFILAKTVTKKYQNVWIPQVTDQMTYDDITDYSSRVSEPFKQQIGANHHDLQIGNEHSHDSCEMHMNRHDHCKAYDECTEEYELHFVDSGQPKQTAREKHFLSLYDMLKSDGECIENQFESKINISATDQPKQKSREEHFLSLYDKISSDNDSSQMEESVECLNTASCARNDSPSLSKGGISSPNCSSQTILPDQTSSEIQRHLIVPKRESVFDQLYEQIKTADCDKTPYVDMIVVDGQSFGSHEEYLDSILEEDTSLPSDSPYVNSETLHGYG